jgi:hypothetical protein
MASSASEHGIGCTCCGQGRAMLQLGGVIVGFYLTAGWLGYAVVRTVIDGDYDALRWLPVLHRLL